MKRKHLTASLARKHLVKYSPYNMNTNWTKWYAKVAPLKGKRTAKILLNYKGDNARVLDLGCGIGLTLAVLAKDFPNSVGCDIGRKEITATRELLKNIGVKIPVILYDGYHLPFADDSFDIVTSVEVYEHVDKPEMMLREINRILKPDGVLLISTANKLWPIEPHYHLPLLSYLPKKLASYYLRLVKRGETYDDINLPSYEKFYRKVNRYFEIKDLTLETIKSYKRYGLDKERGWLIPFIGGFLSRLNLKCLDRIAVQLSLGWLFVAFPRK